MVVGSANTDMVVKATSIPAPGETILGGDFAMVPGGKGANQAVAAARLGAHVRFVGCVGQDMFGRQTRANLASDGIATEWLMEHEGAHSGVALIAVDEHGQNAIVVAPGANMLLTPEHVDRALEAATDLHCVVLQCEIPIPTVVHTMARCVRCGIPVILNPAPACALPQGSLEGVTCVTPNESEARALTGIDVTDANGARKAAHVLLAMGAQSAVITLGSRGALAATDRYMELVPAHPVQAVDATAAGDCFTAALAVSLARAWTSGTPRGLDLDALLQAVQYASAAAALSVTRLGAQPSLPTFAEVDAFLAASHTGQP
jgi:ribokinase